MRRIGAGASTSRGDHLSALVERQPVIRLRHATKIYGTDAVETRALDIVELDVSAGEFVVVLGPSGCGKSTLLNIIGGIDTATSGEVIVDGYDLSTASADQLDEFRRAHVAFVFQMYNLVPTLTALENVQVIAQLNGGSRSSALEALDRVGLTTVADRFPGQLSGGQQQRIAVARALAKQTPIVLCDEPTGALDRQTGRRVVDLLTDLAKVDGRTVVVVTHDELLTEQASRVIRMVDGEIVLSSEPAASGPAW